MSRSVSSRSLLARMRNSWNPGPCMRSRIAARNPLTLAPRSDAYSASVGTRPAKTIAARRSVLRHDSIFTPSNRVAGVMVTGPTSSPPSNPTKRSMSENSSVPAASWMPPP